MKSRPSSKSRRSMPHQRSSNASKYSLPRACAFGVCVALILALALALMCALICTFSENAGKLLSPLSFAITLAVYFVCGFAASKKQAAAIPAGALGGTALSIIFFIISLCLDGSLSSGISLPVTILIRLSFVVVSILGAILGTNAKRKVRRHR